MASLPFKCTENRLPVPSLKAPPQRDEVDDDDNDEDVDDDDEDDVLTLPAISLLVTA